MPPSAVTEKMATGLTDEEQIKFFSDLFSGYETTIHNIQKLSPDEQMADEFNTHENTPINKLLSNVEANYNHDTPVPVLEYVFNRLIDTQEFHTAEAKRLEANGEEDYLSLNNESYSDWIFDTGKDLMHFWTHKADDVRQKILDIGAKRHKKGLDWFYFQSFIAEFFDDESAYDIPTPPNSNTEEPPKKESDKKEKELEKDEETEEGEVKEGKEGTEKESPSQGKEEDENEPPSKRPRLQ